MNRLPWLLSFALLLGCATSHPQLLDGSRLIDLSHAFDSDTIFWPTEKELPARDFTVIALPMNIRGGSGAPLRTLAVVPH